MKIAFVINDLNIGGAEKLIHDITSELARKGCNVTIILTWSRTKRPLEKTLDPDVKVLKLSGKQRFSLPKIRQLAQLFNEFDVVHANLFPTLYLTALASYLVKRPRFFYTEHSTSNRRRQSWWLRGIEKIIYSRYQTIFTVSEAANTTLQEWLPELKDRIVTLENGIRYKEYAKANPIDLDNLISVVPKNRKLIVSVANFRPQKDQPTIIRALEKLPDHIHAIFIGDGETRKDCEDLAVYLGVSHRTHFLGFRKDIAEILKACDLFVLSSHWEGFGLSAIEAMAAGLPAIVSNLPGLADIVGEAAVKFQPGSSEELARMIHQILEDRELRERLIQSGEQQARKYDLGQVAMRYHNYFSAKVNE